MLRQICHGQDFNVILFLKAYNEVLLNKVEMLLGTISKEV